MLRYGLLAGAVVLTSCGGAAPEGLAPRPTSVVALASTPTLPVEPAASEPPPVAAPVLAPATTLAFHPVVTSDEWIGMHPLLDGSLMISAGPRLLRIDPAGTIDDGPALLAGIDLPYPTPEPDLDMQMDIINDHGGWSALQVGGTWPTATFLTLATGHYDPAAAYRWAGDRWARIKPGRTRVVTWPASVRPWKDRSLLAWRELYAPALDLSGQCSDCPAEMYEDPKYKQGARELAATRQLAVLAGPAKAPPLTGKEIAAFDALITGEVFVALGNGAWMVWPAVGEPVTVRPPGDDAVQWAGLVARAADDVLGFGTLAEKPALMRYDGTTFTALDVPACESGLTSLAVVGTTWWTTCASPTPRNYDQLNTQPRAGSLWRREGAGEWQRVALTDGLDAQLVVARGPDDVWVAAYGEQGGTLLHTRDHGPVIALGDMREIVLKGFFAGKEP